MEVAHQSLAQLSRALKSKQISAVELAQAHLDRIESHQDLNAFLDVRPEVTLAQAAAADARLATQEAVTPLTGVPIAHKDIFVTRDFCSTAASKILRGYPPATLSRAHVTRSRTGSAYRASGAH